MTKETVEILAARRPGESSATQTKRIRFLRQFAVFMSTLGFKVDQTGRNGCLYGSPINCVICRAFKYAGHGEISAFT
jgi:hypothetical protein